MLLLDAPRLLGSEEYVLLRDGNIAWLGLRMIGDIWIPNAYSKS